MARTAFIDVPPLGSGSPVHPKPVSPFVPLELRLDMADESSILDRFCAGSDVEIGTDGRSVAIGCGTVLATHGWDSGKHYWECYCEVAGWHSFVGVSTRFPTDEQEIRHGYALPGNDGGFCFAGASSDARMAGCGCEGGAWHAGIETTTRFPFFGKGDRVGLLLDADTGSLALYINGSRVGEAFTGLLRCSEFFPAFASSGQETHFTDITVDLPLPPDALS